MSDKVVLWLLMLEKKGGRNDWKGKGRTLCGEP